MSHAPPDAMHVHGRRVIALVADRRMRARLIDAMPEASHLHFARDVDDLRALAREPTHAVVVSPVDVHGVDLVPTVRWLRAHYPPLPVLAYCAPDGSTSLGTMRLARAGVSQLLIRDLHDSPHELRAALTVAADDESIERAAAALRAVVPDAAWPIVEHCLRHASDALTVRALSASLGVTRQAIAARLRVTRLPPPRSLIFWTRLLVALHRLERPRATIERVALELGFSSSTAFHNAVRRHTGRRLGDLRARGGFAALLDELRVKFTASR